MFRKLCADYLIDQVRKSKLSSDEKSKFMCFIKLILQGLNEAEEVVYNLDEIERTLA
ncbi:hypothetical protein IR123_10030 [Streptococcus sp. 19428wC2_LYSM12]|uniref:hypothetical protein n=1 Tax=unclassified Streptococcus TaxID=2608887 RepID=UPI00142F933A|nr:MULTISPECIES: hypothetical protein [unclassified Streptococcus]MBF0788213.1 hypothetical protein [Streptococcus sp. 19428wC2_LYSM12]